MKERQGQLFPSEVGNNREGYVRPELPDFITLTWYSPLLDSTCSVECDPDRAIDFMIRQEGIEGKELEWE